jgi:hypothetical protein
LTFDDFRTQFDKFIKRKGKKNIFEVKQLHLSNPLFLIKLIQIEFFAFDGNLFVLWEYILINWQFIFLTGCLINLLVV